MHLVASGGSFEVEKTADAAKRSVCVWVPSQNVTKRQGWKDVTYNEQKGAQLQNKVKR
jgi:hypothetical protein